MCGAWLSWAIEKASSDHGGGPGRQISDWEPGEGVGVGCMCLCNWSSICCSVTQLCWTLCNSMDCSTPAFPVLHCLQEFDQIRVHLVSYAIQPSHPVLSPSSPTLNFSQHQSLFQ